MAYSELIKNFDKIRDYMRDFYIYSFKSRNDFNEKSARTYDDAKRHIESWLGDYMQFHQTKDGKNVSLSMDSRMIRHNPLYKAWKTKSFTDGEITLHFIIMDILEHEQEMSLAKIASEIDQRLESFSNARVFDISTVRKKLNEYVKLGLLVRRKEGKTMVYSRSKEKCIPDINVLDFFSEISPCGVIGSFLLDKTSEHKECFNFKHHYITSAMDSEILCQILIAIQDQKKIRLTFATQKKNSKTEIVAIPLQVRISVQSGRQYLMAYTPHFRRITSYRIDHIVAVKIDYVTERFLEFREKLDAMKPHIWGVSTDSRTGNRMEHIEFTLQYEETEQHIPRRLEREKRIGHVETIDSHSSRFIADVYDASELIPWIRTFICRITDISISDKKLEAQFKKDIQTMYEMYGLKGGEDHGVS